MPPLWRELRHPPPTPAPGWGWGGGGAGRRGADGGVEVSRLCMHAWKARVSTVAAPGMPLVPAHLCRHGLEGEYPQEACKALWLGVEPGGGVDQAGKEGGEQRACSRARQQVELEGCVGEDASQAGGGEVDGAAAQVGGCRQRPGHNGGGRSLPCLVATGRRAQRRVVSGSNCTCTAPHTCLTPPSPPCIVCDGPVADHKHTLM